MVLLAVCAATCRACGDQRAKHAERYTPCRVCAEACRPCEQACNTSSTSSADLKCFG